MKLWAPMVAWCTYVGLWTLPLVDAKLLKSFDCTAAMWAIERVFEDSARAQCSYRLVLLHEPGHVMLFWNVLFGALFPAWLLVRALAREPSMWLGVATALALLFAIVVGGLFNLMASIGALVGFGVFAVWGYLCVAFACTVALTLRDRLAARRGAGAAGR